MPPVCSNACRRSVRRQLSRWGPDVEFSKAKRRRETPYQKKGHGQVARALDLMSGISIICFAASYAVALCLEVTRLFLRVSLRTAIMVGFMVAGLIAHSIYLGGEAQQGLASGNPLSSWYHGCLILAWLLAVCYLALSLWRKPTAIGLIFLPTILMLVAIAQVFPRTPQLTGETVHRVWSIAHGVALLLGTAAVIVGFTGGLLYLVQSYRLKHRVFITPALRLPSLERLQRISEGALVTSCWLLVIGLLSGVLLNWRRGAEANLPWSDPVVWSSALLLIWLLTALTFNAFYKPARQGRKLAYLTFASFVFLGLVLAIMILVPDSHGSDSQTVRAWPGRDHASRAPSTSRLCTGLVRCTHQLTHQPMYQLSPNYSVICLGLARLGGHHAT